MASSVGDALDPRKAAKPGHVFEFSPERSARWFGDTGTYGRMGVQGDGSCFYHSICAILNIDNYLHETLARQAKIAHEFRCKFQKDFDKKHFKYLSAGLDTDKTYKETREALCSPRTWADEVMIKYAAAVLDMNIMFVDMNAAALYCGVHGRETLEVASPRAREEEEEEEEDDDVATLSQPTCVVAWVSRSHFEPVVRIEAVEGDRVKLHTLFEPSKSKQDADMVKALMNEYVNQCDETTLRASV